MVEGDLFCAIRYVSGGCATTWALADAVEVKDLAKDLKISFVHVNRSSNLAAHMLAKEGVWY